MTRQSLLKLAQSARNPETAQVLSDAIAMRPGAKLSDSEASEPVPASTGSGRVLKLVILGQIRGSKNAIQVTRTGRRYPNAKWAAWRDFAVAQILSQLPKGWETITEPVSMELDYYAGDRKRRDMPGTCDAVFHCLEKSLTVADDTLLWITRSSRSYSKENPRAEITIHLP